MLRRPKLKFNKTGSAMILTMFVLAGMLIVAISGSYVVMLGIKAGGIQAQSTNAYFAAESGTEDILWQIRSGSLSHDRFVVPPDPLISGVVGVEETYDVYFLTAGERIYTSIGNSRNTKRSVEVRW